MREIIETGILVRVHNGTTGTIHKVFKNFESVTPDFIEDKGEWLCDNGYMHQFDLLKEMWVAIDCFGGGQSLHPISYIEF